LSGILSADFINIASSAFLAKESEDQNLFIKFPIWGHLSNKLSDGHAGFNGNLITAQQAIDVYRRLIQSSPHIVSQPGMTAIDHP